MNRKKSLSRESIGKILSQHVWLAVFLIAAVLASVLFSLVPPMILQKAIDNYILPGNLNGLWPLALAYAGSYLLSGGADFAKGWMLSSLGQKMIHELRMQMMKKLERMKTSYYTSNTPASITSRFISDVSSVGDLFTNGVVSMMADSLKIIGVLVSIAMFSVKLMLLMLCLIPVIYWITRVFQKNVLQAQTDNLKQLGAVNSHISETIRSFPMIRTFRAQSYMENSYNHKLIRNYETKAKVNLYDSLYSPIIQVLRSLAIVLVAFGTAGIGLDLGLSVGMLAASVEYITNLLAPIESLGDEFQSIQSGISGLKRIDAFADEPEEEKKDESLTLEQIAPNGIQEILFDDIDFYYQPGVYVLRDFNLKIEGGTTVTLTGRTGIGKTTLFNLTAGLLVPTKGKVRINSVSADIIPDRIKRRLYGYIEQNFTFVQGDVYRQITLGDKNITDQQVEDACRFVDLDPWIRSLPDGYHTDVSSGSGFSWGQRQLLAIARGLVSDPKILLLDEISANLDAETEKNILSILQKASSGRTILAISHRPSSVLKDSRIVEVHEAVQES